MRESFLPLVRGVYDGCAIVWFFCWISNCHFSPFCWLLNIFLSLPNRLRSGPSVVVCWKKVFHGFLSNCTMLMDPTYIYSYKSSYEKLLLFLMFSLCHCCSIRSFFMPSSPFAYSSHSIFSISKCINSSLTSHWRVMFSQLLPLLINIYGKSHVLSTTWDTHRHRKEKQKLLLSEKRD